jgi:hypothetical protein
MIRLYKKLGRMYNTIGDLGIWDVILDTTNKYTLWI